MIIDLTQEEIDYIDKKLSTSRFTMEDYYIVESILVKFNKIEPIRLARKNSTTFGLLKGR